MRCYSYRHGVVGSRGVIIPCDAGEDFEIGLAKGHSTSKEMLVGIEFKEDQDTVIAKKTGVNYICNRELEVSIGDGVNQYYDVVEKCSKVKGGCGFFKQMGNEKWIENHCEHCNAELSQQEKDAGLSCSKCIKEGLVCKAIADLPVEEVEKEILIG
jgi:hypothetical protein